MTVADYDEAIALWNACEGVRTNETREEMARILARNPGISCVVRARGELIAAVLGCHDGRRGYLYHLGVAAAHRRRGLGQRMVEHCLAHFHAAGIRRATIFRLADNESGAAFWRQAGWRDRTDLKAMAIDLD